MISQSAIENIISSAPVEVYLSENSGILNWPWRMNAAHDASEQLAEGTETYIVDSSFQRDDIGTEFVLDKAAEISADIVALVDVYGSRKKTVDSILKDIEIVDDHEFEGEIMVPLQPPHDKCYLDLEDVGDLYGIGGVAKESAEAKVKAAERARKVAGDDEHLHGLGWGMTQPVVEAIRSDPGLVDSIDSKSAYDKAMTENMDDTWMANTGNSGRGAVVSLHAGAYLLESIRRMSPEMTESPHDRRASSGAEGDW